MKPFYLCIPLCALLTACADDYAFNSNLDREQFNDYFKPSEVTLYTDTAPTQEYEVIKLVTGEACQSDANGMPVTLADARTAARRNAADLNANGILIKSCIISDEPEAGCFSYAQCVGQAIRIESTDS